LGVSLVICCHNSSARLPATFDHIIQQKSRDIIPWEVIVVDNGSTDNTADRARALWDKIAHGRLRIVNEPLLGLSNARRRGLEEARYEYVSFIDDDNWICHDWIQVIYDVMGGHPEVGACGSESIAECQVEPPSWFDIYKENFAVGRQAEASGDITDTRGYLWGAGITIRKSAWQMISSSGFTFLLSDRKGNMLSSGGDSELCFALSRAGWRLWYEQRLVLKHYLPAARLTIEYLKRLMRGIGASTVGFDPYISVNKPTVGGHAQSIRYTWQWQSCSALFAWMKTQFRRLFMFGQSSESKLACELTAETIVGRLMALLRSRSEYNFNMTIIRNAAWIKKGCCGHGPIS